MRTLRKGFLLVSIFIFTVFIIFIKAPIYAGEVYTGTWTDSSGRNHTSEPSYGSSGSGASNGKGGIIWRLFNPQPKTYTPKPVYDPRTDISLVKKKARKAFKKGDWNDAVYEASSYLNQTGWKDKKILYLYARSSHLELEKWVREGRRDETWDWRYGQVVERYGHILMVDPKNRKALKYLQELHALLDEVRVQGFANQIKKAINEGSNFEEEENWEDAAAAYSRAIDVDSGEPYAHERLGWCLTKMGRNDEANQAYKRAIATGTKEMFVYGRLVMNMTKNGNGLDEALLYAREAIEIDPDHLGIHQIEGEVLIKLNRFKEAAESYRKAISLNKSEHSSYERLGLVYSEMGESDKAIKAFKDAIAAGSQSRKVFSRLSSELSDDSRQLNKVLRFAQRTIEISPGSIAARQLESEIFIKMERFEEAGEAIARALKIDANDEAVLGVSSIINGARKKFDEELKDIKKLRIVDPDNIIYELRETITLSNIENKKNAEKKNVLAVSGNSTEQQLTNLMQEENPESVVLKTSTATLGMKNNKGVAVDLSKQTIMSQDGKKSAGEQLKSVKFHSDEAIKRLSDEGTKSEAFLGFDTEGSSQGSIKVLDLKGVFVYDSDPQVPKEYQTPEIVDLVDKRTEIRIKRNQKEKELEKIKIAPIKDVVKIAKIKMVISNINNEEHFINFSIKEKLKRPSNKVKNLLKKETQSQFTKK